MSRFWLGLGIAAFTLWPACGGQSIRYEEDPDEPTAGDSGFGADGGGGVSGATGARGGVTGTGGSSIPRGGVGATPNGGVGATPTGGVGAAPTGGVGAAPTGGVGALGGVGFGGVGNSPFGGASGFGGFGFGGAGFGGFGFGGASGASFGGFDFGGAAGFGGVGGRGRGMGGRGPGMGGRGNRGMGGRGLGGGGTGGVATNPIDGFVFLTTCTADRLDRWCYLTPVCPNAEPPLPGIHPTDVTVTMPGASGVFYDMVIRVQGLVESKTYSGGVDQDNYSLSQPADGFYSGGRPSLTASSAYVARVTSPDRAYFLNSISPPAMSSVAPPTWVDYRATIRFEGGTTVRLVSADSDCAVLRNCGTPASSSDCSPVSVPDLAPAIAARVPAQPYDGQFLGIIVESVTLVAF